MATESFPIFPGKCIEFILGRGWINCNLQQVNSLSRCHQVLQLTDLLNCSRKTWFTGHSEIHTGTKTLGPGSKPCILQGSLKIGSSTKVTFIPAPKVDERDLLWSWENHQIETHLLTQAHALKQMAYLPPHWLTATAAVPTGYSVKQMSSV